MFGVGGEGGWVGWEKGRHIDTNLAKRTCAKVTGCQGVSGVGGPNPCQACSQNQLRLECDLFGFDAAVGAARLFARDGTMAPKDATAFHGGTLSGQTMSRALH